MTPRSSSRSKASQGTASASAEGPVSGEPAVVPKQAVEVQSAPRHWIIRASAGSGKTFQLSNQYIARLRESPPDRILATTFTRKAAGEILERILLRLARAGLREKDLKELAAFVGDPPLRQPDSLRLLKEMTRHLHRMRVSTLDSFFSKLATSFTLELGLPPGWRMIDDVEDRRFRMQAAEAMLRDETTDSVVLLMNRLAKGRVVRSVQGLISDAIANHYQTYLMTEAAAWSPFPLLAFLPEEELAAALAALQSYPVEGAAHLKARNEDLERARTGDWESFLQKGIAGKIVQDDLVYMRKAIPDPLVEVYGPLMEHARAALIVPWAHQNQATRELLDRFHAAYEELKREQRGYRFEDVTRRLARHLSGRSADSLAYRLDAGIDHLLLDEFQDTSPAQWDVLRPFAQTVVSGEGTSFFCVGDTKQAIYGWRGGLAAIFDAIEEELAGVARRPLDESYRSAPLVIETVNKVFAGIPRHSNLDTFARAVELFSKAFPEHRTARGHLPGYVRLECPPLPPAPTGEGEEAGDEPEVSEDDLLEFTADRVAELAAKSPEATIGVLVRTNGTVGRIVHKLQRRHVEASEEGGSPLTDSAAVQLVLSLFRLADHPGHAVARFHVAHSPLGPLYGFTDHDDDEGAERLATQLRTQLVDEGYSRTLYRIALELMPTCGPRDGRRLRQLVDQAAAFELQATLRPTDFVEYVETQKVQDPTEARIRVMNIHQSKGLEFDIVVLPELDKDLRPVTPSHVYRVPSATQPPDCVLLYRDKLHVSLLPPALQGVFREAEAREVTEALCILYVMLTRAVHALHMIVRPNPNEKSTPKTFAGLVRAALSECTPPLPGQVIYEAGDPEWAAAHAPKVETAQVPSPVSPPEDDVVRFAPAEGGRRRGLHRVTPSRAKEERTERVRLSGVLRLGTSEALDRGTLYHAWFEKVTWLDETVPGDEQIREISRARGAVPALVERSPADFRATLRAEAVGPRPIADALTKGAYSRLEGTSFAADVLEELRGGPFELEVATERRLAVIDEGELIAGTIDRLVLFRRGGRVVAAEILDFKTDVVEAGQAAIRDKVEAYRGQMALYRRAVGRIYGLGAERIAARLLFLGPGTVVGL
ncbi:UvrD-helicase domain-containing protein [Planctomyces sp. SH-PL14]|uniref:UvrD-helicase domain-containing protein n=1 Tax=Planctomyces sp. SH-PL14 TaxID=1632864 RepID=UPI00078E12DF|nr:UvrD-helicase domain-containing protein [Planctomyces sp. SH-PL14]AMV17707.1 ATP-dependent helicase/nuclease subunit A [Planctomyces sp. SH-PL14]